MKDEVYVDGDGNVTANLTEGALEDIRQIIKEETRKIIRNELQRVFGKPVIPQVSTRIALNSTIDQLNNSQ